MPFRLTNRMLSIVLLTLVLVVTGCSGGGGDDDADGGEPVSAATSAEIDDTMSDVLPAAIAAALGSTSNTLLDGQPRQGPVDPSGSCVDGQVSVSNSGSVDQTTGDINFEATLEFDNCDGISGTLTLDGDGTITEEEINFEFTLNGSVDTPTCDISMAFSQDITLVLETEESTMTVDGSITGSCSEENFACTFKGVGIDLDSPDAQTKHYEENCHLT